MQFRTRFSVKVAAAAAVVAVALSAAPAALGQAQIKVSDTINMKFGILLQPQVDWLSSPTVDGSYSQNFQLRRLRFMVGGQVAKDVFFFAQTENARLGGTGGTTTGSKNLAAGFQMLDATAEWRIAKAFAIQGGLVRVPTSREGLKSSASEFAIDTVAFATAQTAAVGGNSGRDLGFMARGFFIDDRLEYRLGAFQGNRNGAVPTSAASNNAFRYAGRLQYNFFDTELWAFVSYPGAYLGTKTILNIGAAYDSQDDYKGYTFDAYVDVPIKGGSVEGTFAYTHADGGLYAPTLQKQDYFQAEVGVYGKAAKIGPWARYERRNYAAPNNGKNESRYSVGLGWFPYGWNLNIKGAWVHVEPNQGLVTNQFTVQMQVYYF